MSNAEARHGVLGLMVQSLEYTLNQNRLRWFCMFCICPKNDCLVVRCCLGKVMSKDWSLWPVDDVDKNMKALTKRLVRVDPLRLPHCGPREWMVADNR